jgi:hypothetical protein
MTHTEQLLAIALPFVWLGLVLGISVLETPLKFRAPGITLALGLAIGRLVFRALNRVELVLAVALTLVVAQRARSWPLVVLGVTDALLLAQVLWLRPRLDRRALRIIAGDEAPASSLHLVYIALEGVKVVLLPVIGAGLAWRWIA